MASTLQELRKRAGYETAKDFAEALGVPATTYVGWESKPEKIPLKSAWRLADWFRCTIDVVVGRDPSSVASLRGDVQEAYDSLDEDEQLHLDSYLCYLLHEKAERRDREERERRRRMERLCEHYEDRYLKGLEDTKEGRELLLSGSPERLREGFSKFLRDELPAGDEGSDPVAARDARSELMEIYDEYHPSPRRVIEATYEYAFVPLDEVSAEYDGARRHGKGGEAQG